MCLADKSLFFFFFIGIALSGLAIRKMCVHILLLSQRAFEEVGYLYSFQSRFMDRYERQTALVDCLLWDTDGGRFLPSGSLSPGVPNPWSMVWYWATAHWELGHTSGRWACKSTQLHLCKLAGVRMKPSTLPHHRCLWCQSAELERWGTTILVVFYTIVHSSLFDCLWKTGILVYSILNAQLLIRGMRSCLSRYSLVEVQS